MSELFKVSVEFQPLIVGELYPVKELEKYFNKLVSEGETQVRFKYHKNDCTIYAFNLERMRNHFRTEAYRRHIKNFGWKAGQQIGQLRIDFN